MALYLETAPEQTPDPIYVALGGAKMERQTVRGASGAADEKRAVVFADHLRRRGLFADSNSVGRSRPFDRAESKLPILRSVEARGRRNRTLARQRSRAYGVDFPV